MNNNITTNVSNEALTPRFCKGAVSGSALLELVKDCWGGQTWWMSDFYEGFCKLYDLDFNNIDSNVRKIRRELNNQVKLGKLKKMKLGTGHGGKGLFNSTSFTLWVLS
jgi:hypothetical protein